MIGQVSIVAILVTISGRFKTLIDSVFLIVEGLCRAVLFTDLHSAQPSIGFDSLGVALPTSLPIQAHIVSIVAYWSLLMRHRHSADYTRYASFKFSNLWHVLILSIHQRLAYVVVCWEVLLTA